MLLLLSLGCLLGSLSGEHFVWYGMNLPSGFNALLALAGLVGLFVNQHRTRREAEESTLALMEGEENGRISKRVKSIADTLGNIESVVARTTRMNVIEALNADGGLHAFGERLGVTVSTFESQARDLERLLKALGETTGESKDTLTGTHKELGELLGELHGLVRTALRATRDGNSEAREEIVRGEFPSEPDLQGLEIEWRVLERMNKSTHFDADQKKVLDFLSSLHDILTSEGVPAHFYCGVFFAAAVCWREVWVEDFLADARVLLGEQYPAIKNL